jgi:hypothetical protein
MWNPWLARGNSNSSPIFGVAGVWGGPHVAVSFAQAEGYRSAARLDSQAFDLPASLSLCTLIQNSCTRVRSR